MVWIWQDCESMKRFFTLLLVAMLPVAASAQSLPLRSPSEGLPFKGGEKFTYKLHYKLGIINSDVASASISVDSTTYAGKKAYSARIFGQTAKFYDTFFKVREDFRSTFDASMTPLHFYRDTREGGWYCKNDVKYNWASSSVNFTLENSNTPEPTTSVIPIKPGTCDITSMVFMMRNVDVASLEQGKTYIGTMMLDGEVFTMSMTYTGLKNYKDKLLGTVEVIRFAVRLNAGETFDTKEDLVFLFTNDENRIPVSFEAPFKFGAVSGRLLSCVGLKNPNIYNN